MIKKILLGLVVALLALVGFIASRPSAFTVQRSLAMKAKPEYIFPFVNSFYRWTDWSPWNFLDPEMKRTYEGPVVGVGSVYAWSGNDKVGEGRMTLEESRKNELVRIKLELTRPFASTSTTTLTIKPASEGSEVTWALEGHRDFMGKTASLFVDMDAMIGKDFEAGLATLRLESEARQEGKEEQKRLDDAVRKAMAEVEPNAGYRPGKFPPSAGEK
jgi:Polyketide cyclase / dehydrase and lipid transport